MIRIGSRRFTRQVLKKDEDEGYSSPHAEYIKGIWTGIGIAIVFVGCFAAIYPSH